MWLYKKNKKSLKKICKIISFEYITLVLKNAGIAQLARASAFQAEGCEFESHYPLHFKIYFSEIGAIG